MEYEKRYGLAPAFFGGGAPGGGSPCAEEAKRLEGSAAKIGIAGLALTRYHICVKVYCYHECRRIWCAAYRIL